MESLKQMRNRSSPMQTFAGSQKAWFVGLARL
jgi:hypothetical protein